MYAVSAISPNVNFFNTLVRAVHRATLLYGATLLYELGEQRAVRNEGLAHLFGRKGRALAGDEYLVCMAVVFDDLRMVHRHKLGRLSKSSMG